MKYPVVIWKETNSDYGVIVPDIEGCYSAGSTLEEAIANAKEAIECHLEGIIVDGEEYPSPSSIDDIANSEYYSSAGFTGAVFALVEVNLNKALRWGIMTREEGGN